MTEAEGPEDVAVLATWAPKGERFPSGKRWVAFCTSCKWQRHVGWKGQYRVAWSLAMAHRCEEAVGG
jgi:hypothetical protein